MRLGAPTADWPTMIREHSFTPRTSEDHHLDVDALGVTVRIEIGGLPPLDREHLAEAWSGALTETRASIAATVTPRPHFHFDETVADLTTQVTLAALSARRGELWMVHAGAVADEDGRVVMFSGRSGMGKTTLMSHLARDYAYVTDESVGVTVDGRVTPYRKPLSIIDDSARAKSQVSPRRLGLRDLPPAPLRLHAVVVLDRDPRYGTARLEGLDIADALEAIAPQCSYLADLPHPLETLIGHIRSVGGAVRLRYRESADAIALVRELLSAPRPLSSEPVIAHPVTPHRGATGYTRTPVLDAVTIGDDRLALLRRDAHDEITIQLIDGIAPALWRAADGVTFEELVSAAVRAYGDPPDGQAADAVRAALTELSEAGVLTERTA